MLEIPWNPKGDILRSLAPSPLAHGIPSLLVKYIWKRLVFKGGTTTFRIIVNNIDGSGGG